MDVLVILFAVNYRLIMYEFYMNYKLRIHLLFIPFIHNIVLLNIGGERRKIDWKYD